MNNCGKLAGKTIFISGASRGIGKAIALKAAKDGAKIVIAAKTAEPHPKLPGTIYTAAKEIEEAGGQALPIIVDVRHEESVQTAIEESVKQFGTIDILVNNASAISLTGTQSTQMKTFDLMNQINMRGTFLCSKLCLPYLKDKKDKNAHILNLSPPLNMRPKWFKNNVAYTIAKYGMSMCVLGMAEELKRDGIAVNALWPKTAIYTAAMEMIGGGKSIAPKCRNVDIMADAAYVMLTRDSKSYSGNFAIDEMVLREEGCTDFEKYLMTPGTESNLLLDFFLDDDMLVSASEKAEKVNKTKTGSSSNSISDIFDKVRSQMKEDLVGEVGAVYQFCVKKQNSSEVENWYIDLKHGSGECSQGQSATKADVIFDVKESDFIDLFEGRLRAMTAFMTGKLSISGDLPKAIKLDKLMGKMQAKKT